VSDGIFLINIQYLNKFNLSPARGHQDWSKIATDQVAINFFFNRKIIMKIHPKVYRVDAMFPIYQYLIVEPNSLVLIDTGFMGNQKRVINNIKTIGLGPEDIIMILITHSDGDHYGALNAMEKVTKARVGASAIEAEAIRTGSVSREMKATGLQKTFFNLFSKIVSRSSKDARVDDILVPGQVLPFLGGLRILDTTGHTPGHLSFYSESEGILFAGDSIVIQKSKPVPSSGSICWDEDKARQAYDMQMKLNPKLICAGHGLYQI
jgi:glyoxylase-like metal-dependent hydrolase (beta-lactamase superfamily II)